MTQPTRAEAIAYCTWAEDEFTWSTGCGEMFEFTTDGIEENGFKFCPYCGKQIDAIRYEEEEINDE